jgi:(S)-3,5-dihydroxyphenylglycine transaminase
MSDLHASVSDPVLDTMTFLNEVTQRYPDAISFAPGRPYDGFLDPAQSLAAVQRYLDHLAGRHGPERARTLLCQYGPTAGLIRELIAEFLAIEEGIAVAPESVVVTVGCQESILVTLRALFARPEDVLIVAEPCYVGVLGAARLLDVGLVGVPERANGVDCADVASAIEQAQLHGRRPRAVYVVPDHANPSGCTLDERTRSELLGLAERYDVLLLEDSPYRLVSPGERMPTLKALDRGRRVIHLGSFAKTVIPGARVGYVVADQTVRDRDGARALLADQLTKIKSMVTVNTSPISQAVVGGILLATEGRLSAANAAAAAHYGDALRRTLDALDRHIPEPVRARHAISWTEPTGGFFLTVRLPFEADEAALARSAAAFGVIWTPMRFFHTAGGGDFALRLSISSLSAGEIEEGVARLARFVYSELAASNQHPARRSVDPAAGAISRCASGAATPSACHLDREEALAPAEPDLTCAGPAQGITGPRLTRSDAMGDVGPTKARTPQRSPGLPDVQQNRSISA